MNEALFDAIFESGYYPFYDTGIFAATWWPLHNQWSANSQYGYVMSWHDTREQALQAARAFYDARRELIFQ